MANTTTPRSSIYNGWFYDAVTPAMKYYNRGTLVLTAATAALTTAGTLATTGAATLATGVTTGNHTFANTITAGADGVGASGERLTSGGAGAACDWAAN
jgi:hypothetical protein